MGPTPESIMPRFKIIELPVLPIEGTSGDATPFIIMLVLFGLAALSFLRGRNLTLARGIILTFSSLFLVIMVHRTMCFIRGWLFGLQLVGKNNLLAFYYLSMFVALTFFGLVAGGLFCGWMCPVGLIQEIAGRIGLLKKRLGPVTAMRIDLGLSAGILIIFIYMVARAGPYSSTSIFISENTSTLLVGILLVLIPFMVLSRTLQSRLWWLRNAALGFRVVVLGVGIWVTNPGCTLFESEAEASSMITLLAVILASLVISRAYCRYICPFGAWLGILSRFSILGMKFPSTQGATCGFQERGTPADHDRCSISCGRCVSVCPSGALDDGRRDPSFCIMCGRCHDRCGRKPEAE